MRIYKGEDKIMKKNFKKRYVKKIRHCFPIYGKEERRYLKELSSYIDEYIESNPEVSEEKIIQEFGSPSNVAGEYLLGADEKYLFKKLRISHFIKSGISIFIILILLYNIYISYLAYLDYKDALNYQISTEEITIETIKGK